jgi:hypothetical protein
MTITYTYKHGYTCGRAKMRPAVHQPSWLDTHIYILFNCEI